MTATTTTDAKPESRPVVFIDPNGKSWPVRLTVGLVEDLDAQYGIDLESIFMGGGEPLGRLLYESSKRFLDIFADLCSVPNDRQERTSQRKAFCRGFGRAELDHARQTILEALATFYLPPSAVGPYVSHLPAAIAGQVPPGSPTLEAGSGLPTSTAGSLA
jgi:hypothetical protein